MLILAAAPLRYMPAVVEDAVVGKEAHLSLLTIIAV